MCMISLIYIKFSKYQLKHLGPSGVSGNLDETCIDVEIRISNINEA